MAESADQVTAEPVEMGVIDQEALDFLNENWLSDDELTRKENAQIVTDYRKAMRLLNDETTMALDLETMPDPALLLPKKWDDVTPADLERVGVLGRARVSRDDAEAVKAWETSNLLRKYGALSPWKGKIAVLALYGPSSNVCAIIHRPGGDMPEEFIRWLSSPTPSGEKREYVTHNGVCFDILYMAVNGMSWEDCSWWDTLISEQTSLTSGRKDISVSLGKVFQRRLGRELKGKVDHEHWANAWLTREQMDYVTGDIKYLHNVRDDHLRICGKDPGERTRVKALKWEMTLLPIVAKMQLRGIPIDMEALGRYLEQQKEIQERTQALLFSELGEINFNSVPQLKRAFEAKGYPLANTREETFKDLAIEHAGTPFGELCSAMIDYRHAKKRQSMYSDEFVTRYVVYHPEYDFHFVHPNFRQLGTDTGRFSATNPNMQQAPRDMRWVYGNVPGWSMVGVDFSAIEVRAMAAICGCEALIEALKQEDIHTYVASQIFEKDPADVTKDERQIAKACTFTLIFFGSPAAVAAYAKQFGGKLSVEDAEVFSRKFYQRFPGVALQRDEARRITNLGGTYTIVLPSGIRRHLIGNDNLTPQRIMNTLVQGTAAVFVKRALIDTAKVALPWSPGETLADRLCATIHDEILMMVENEHAEWARGALETVMVNAAYKVLGHRVVPIAAEGKIGPTWPK